MRQPRRGLGWAALALGTVGLSGCLGFLHPVHTPPPEVLAPCQCLPRCCRDHVYVFLINGLDPVNYGNLTGVRDYINSLGIRQTYYGQIYHVWEFEGDIRRIHHEDPNARFVLVGFSLGVNMADVVARAVEPDGVHIDLMVFLSGNHPVEPMPADKPANVGRVVNVLASGVMATRGERDWAENIRLRSTLHFDSPTHLRTLEVLAAELAGLAGTVPVVEPPLPPAPKRPEEAPTPRPVNKPPVIARNKDWDFLKPAARLGKMSDEDMKLPENPPAGDVAAKK